MRSLAIIVIGSLPLAVLTAESLLELRTFDGRPVQASAPKPPALGALDASAGRLEAEKAALEKWSEADPMLGDTLYGVEGLPAESRLRKVEASGPVWHSARELAERSLRLSRSQPKTDLPSTMRALESLKADYQSGKTGGRDAMVAILDRRIATLERQIARTTLQAEADALLAQARNQFHTQRFRHCAATCQQWLEKYATLDAATVENVRLLASRAAFRDEMQEMSVEFRSAPSMATRKAIVEGFLRRHADRSNPTASEKAVLDHCRLTLTAIDKWLEVRGPEGDQSRRDNRPDLYPLKETPP